jgi:hypothetical protein
MSHAEPEHNRPEGNPLYEHHPSCTPNDRDLVWHCHQCGLNESAADIEEKYNQAVDHLTQLGVESVAAEREAGVKVYLQLTLLEKKLAAERESHEKELDTVEANWSAELAAERERYEKLRMETTGQVTGQSKKGNDPAANRDSDSFPDSRTVIKSYSAEAFAAERENAKQARNANIRTNEMLTNVRRERDEAQKQFAAERETTEAWGNRLKACSEDNDKLCSQLDIAVEALKQVAAYGYIDTAGRNRRVAKAALGRLEPPPRQTWNIIKHEPQ